MRIKNFLYPMSLLLLLASAACNEEIGVKMPLDTVYYPTYMVQSPVNKQVVYFVNGNFDLQYTTGSIEVLDLSQVTADGDGLAVINKDGSLRIDSFGGELAFTADGRRAIIPIRGGSAVLPMSISADGKTISCKTEGRDCQEKSQILLPEAFGLDQDPANVDDFYSIANVPGGDGGNDRFIIGTLGYSNLLPIQWPQNTYEVKAEPGYYGGTGGIADLLWLEEKSLLLGASQYVENRDSRLFVVSNNKSPFSIQKIDVYGQFAGSSVNAMAKVDDHRILLSNTFPHTLVMVDLDIKDRDRSQGAIVWSSALEGESADLLVYDHPILGKLAFVSVMDTDIIEVFAISTGISLGRIYTQGGPFSMAIGQGGDGSSWLCVTEFYSHGVAIYDISAAAVSHFSLKQRINDGTHSMAKRDY